MNKTLTLIMLLVAASLVGCRGQTGDYMAASSISKNGFAIDGKEMRQRDGQEVKLWGYVDHGNLYGDEDAKKILQEWWSGEGPTATTWRFNLKATENDETGRSFPVHVPDDQGRDEILKAFLADARAQKPTKVYVKGKLSTFDAPTNAEALTGLVMELKSSDDILFEPPAATPAPPPATEAAATEEAATPVAEAAPVEAVFLSVQALKNATYSGIYEQPITLADGLYEGEPAGEGDLSRPQVWTSSPRGPATSPAAARTRRARRMHCKKAKGGGG